tara:strand:- start:551 stop:1657 length:1107 start_codon:yes stop_codon:yes gene_type:complete
MADQRNWPFFIAPQVGIPAAAEGRPGVGKTQIIGSLAEPTARIYHHMEVGGREHTELAGLPKPITTASGDEIYTLIPDEILHRVGTEPSILLLDEINQTNEQMMAALQYFLTHQPECCWLFMAFNPIRQSTAGIQFSCPFVNRIMVVEWEFDRDSWAAGMRNHGHYPVPQIPVVPDDWRDYRRLNDSLIADFCMNEGSQYHAPDPNMDSESEGKPYPSPRQWENVARYLAACAAVGADPQTERIGMAGLIGVDAAESFVVYRESLHLPDAEWCLWHPEQFVEEHWVNRGDLIEAIITSVLMRVRDEATPEAWEQGRDFLSALKGKNEEYAIEMRGPLWKLKPEGHEPRVGVNEDIDELLVSLVTGEDA